MQIDENVSFDQFSHDLTLALEETSKVSGAGRWGVRRRTRSTGNLPFPPQPTEEDSSNDSNNNDQFHNGTSGHLSNSILSDSDDRHSFSFAFKLRQTTYFIESDSLNENHSPSKPNVRRKRKFRRIAAEYDTASTSHPTSFSMFPALIGSKKRVLKHNQENLRGNSFFGKRKRNTRERYADFEAFKHSSSVPRQRGFISHKEGALSFMEYKSRNRASSLSASKKPSMEKILPLNKNILLRIEKISKESKSKVNFNFVKSVNDTEMATATSSSIARSLCAKSKVYSQSQSKETAYENDNTESSPSVSDRNLADWQKISSKSESFESTLPHKKSLTKAEMKKRSRRYPPGYSLSQKPKHQFKLQFDDQNFMDCGNLNGFLSSSSLSSSSDSEEMNESEHEGDDELTDWPGQEAMVNFASKHEFKKANKKNTKSIQTKQPDVVQDDDTLMSADDMHEQDCEELLETRPNNFFTSHPINIQGSLENRLAATNSKFPQLKQSEESGVSGESSNIFLSSSNTLSGEVREIRAGCRRVREESYRPGYSIGFNEDILKFLQDDQTNNMMIIYNVQEYKKILELAKLYSLNIQTDENYIVLNKTCNTASLQAVEVSHDNKPYLFNDYKRRCVE